MNATFLVNQFICMCIDCWFANKHTHVMCILLLLILNQINKVIHQIKVKKKESMISSE